jgi:long-chain acyl-CoA synthetase
VITHPSCAAVLAQAATPEIDLVVCVSPTRAAPWEGPAIRPAGTTAFDDLLRADALAGEALDPNSLAHLQLTGGTTGRSKGVRVLHRNLVVHALQQSAWRSGHVPALDAEGRLVLRPAAENLQVYPLQPGAAVTITVAPMFHGLALVGLAMNLLTGTTLLLPGRFDAHAYLAAVERHGVTYVVGAPAFYHALLNALDEGDYDMSSVRATYCGGAPLDTTSLTRIRR